MTALKIYCHKKLIVERLKYTSESETRKSESRQVNGFFKLRVLAKLLRSSIFSFGLHVHFLIYLNGIRFCSVVVPLGLNI